MKIISCRKKICLLGKTGLFVLSLCCLLMGCNLFSGGDSIDEYEISFSDNDELLENLGFTLNDTEPSDDYGEPIGDRNPFGSKLVSLYPKYEVFLGSLGDLDIDDSLQSTIYEGSTSGLTELADCGVSLTKSWVDMPKKSINADMDGDGYEEIITVIFDYEEGAIEIRLGDYREGTADQEDFYNDIDLDPIEVDYLEETYSYLYFHRRDVTAGDFDNDGTSEVIFSVSGHVFLFDYSNGSYVATEVLSDLEGKRTRVEAGDLNGDDYCDLVLLDGIWADETASYYIFEGSANGLGLNGSSSLNSASVFDEELKASSSGYSSAEMVIADINGDGWNEIVFGGVKASDERQLMYCVIDPYNEPLDSNGEYDPGSGAGYYQNTELFSDDSLQYKTDYSGSHYYKNFSVPRVVAGDFNGDGLDEFGIMDFFFTYNSSSGDVTKFAEGVFDFEPDLSCSHDMYFDTAVVGDVTGDGIDDLVFLEVVNMGWSDATKATCEFDQMVVWGNDSLSDLTEIYRDDISADESYPSLCLANINSDSIVMSFNRRELCYSSPQILAVIASPPYNEYMETGNACTTYTTVSGSESTDSYSFGFTAGAMIGAKVGVSAWDIFSFEKSVEFSTEQSFAWGWSDSTSQSVEYGSSAYAGNDMVLYAAIPLDIYVYDVLSQPEDSDLGDTLTVSIPRAGSEIQQLFKSVESYNSLVSEEYQIPDDMLSHEIGDPDSYYPYDELDDLKADYSEDAYEIYDGTTQCIAEGMGDTSINMSKEWGSSSTYDYNSSITREYGVVVVVALASVSLGFDYAYSCENYSYNGYSIAGTSGYLLSDSPSDASFGWGIMKLPQSFNDQRYDLITYWVNPEFGE